MKREIVIGKTSNGGVMMEVIFLNDDEEAVDKYEATKALVSELDEDGNVICETKCFISG